MSAGEWLAGASTFFGYFLPVVGVVALVFLALLFKKMIETLKEVDRALILIDEQVRKLDVPLEAVENISKSVDDVNTKAREAASSASKSLAAGGTKVKTWFNEKREDGSLHDNVHVLKKNFNDVTTTVKDTVCQASDFVSECIHEKKSDLKEFPVYHGQKEDE